MRTSYLFILFLLCLFSKQKGMAQYNPIPYIVNDDKGYVTFGARGIGKDDLQFHIFGSGYYSAAKKPSHQFHSGNYSEDTKIFYSKPYKPNKPTERSISPSGSGYKWYGSETNTPVSLTGDIDVKESWLPASHEGNEHFYMLVFENKNDEITDGCVEFHYNSTEININFAGILIYNDWVYNQTMGASSQTGCDSKIRWNFDTLKHDVQRVVYIPTEVIAEKGSTITRLGKYFDDCQGTCTYSDSNSSLVSGSPHDPNYKQANRECILPSIPDQQSLEYIIHFHNDGTGPAQDVFVSDFIPPELDLNSFVFLDSKNPLTYTINNVTREIAFVFDDIFLPGLEQDNGDIGFTFEETTSWLRFKICTVANIPPNHCISNIASIIFDTEPVFYTAPSRLCAFTNESCSFDSCN